MKIALVQINTTVGDLAGNEKRILEAYRRAAASGAGLVLFPELATTGYPPRDLLLRPRFVTENLAVLDRLAAATGDAGMVVGYVGRNEKRPGREVTNSVALPSQFLTTLMPWAEIFWMAPFPIPPAA